MATPTPTTDPSQIDWPPAPEASTLHHPRILCLHGGGTNARIFHMQCRGLAHRLRTHFRLVFAEAPFPSTAGPDVLTVYSECGPFKRWVLTVAPNAVERQPVATWRAIESSLAVAMARDDAVGATGDWVAVLGFSQGAKIAASLLLRAQERGMEALEACLRRAAGGHAGGKGKVGFKAGVLMAGRGPLIPLVLDGNDDDVDKNNNNNNNDDENDDEEKRRRKLASWLGADERFHYDGNKAAHRLLGQTPTIHVHGLQDPGLDYHRVLLEDWCELGTTTLIEWEGNHRLPIKTGDVVPVVDSLVRVLKRQGVVLPAGGK